jgi:hypothetical protein
MIDGIPLDNATHTITNGIWSIQYELTPISADDGETEDLTVHIRIIANTSRVYQRRIRYQHRHARIMSDYLKCVSQFTTGDIQSSTVINQLYFDFQKWRNDITGMEITPVLERMKAIIDEMWIRIDQLYQQNNASFTIGEEAEDTSDTVADLTSPPSLNYRRLVPQVHTAQRSTLFPYLRAHQSESSSTASSTIDQTPSFARAYQTPQRTPSHLLTPSQTMSSIHMMRSQTAQGNYAFIGRMMTESYSQQGL